MHRGGTFPGRARIQGTAFEKFYAQRRCRQAVAFLFWRPRTWRSRRTDVSMDRSSMADDKTVYMTEEGLEELKEELHRLRTEERSRIADEIAEARAKGDLSENAEYDAAKEEQGKLEARIAEIEDTIARARIVDESTVDDSKAYILSKVTVENMDTSAEQTYTLVSEQEADVSEGKISVESPIGEGLLGQEEGDEVEIEVPAGTVRLKIVDISR